MTLYLLYAAIGTLVVAVASGADRALVVSVLPSVSAHAPLVTGAVPEQVPQETNTGGTYADPYADPYSCLNQGG